MTDDRERIEWCYDYQDCENCPYFEECPDISDDDKENIRIGRSDSSE